MMLSVLSPNPTTTSQNVRPAIPLHPSPRHSFRKARVPKAPLHLYSSHVSKHHHRDAARKLHCFQCMLVVHVLAQNPRQSLGKDPTCFSGRNVRKSSPLLLERSTDPGLLSAKSLRLSLCWPYWVGLGCCSSWLAGWLAV